MGLPNKQWAEKVRRRQQGEHKSLLEQTQASWLKTQKGRERFRAVSDEVASREHQSEIEASCRASAQADVADPRVKGSKTQGVMPIFEKAPETGHVRFRRAPNSLDPSDLELPETSWRLRHHVEPSPEESRRAAVAAIRRAFEEERFTLAQTLPYRIRVAYRITREIARLKGLIGEDETLAEGLSQHRLVADAWTIPTEVSLPPSGRPGRNVPAAHAMTIMRDALSVNLLDQNTTYPMTEGEEPRLIGAGGLSLMPPDIPLRWRERPLGGVVPQYDERHDVMLKRWIALVEEVAGYLAIERGAKNDPSIGQLGLIGLVDVETARSLWPSRLQIVYWEEQLISDTLAEFVRTGAAKTRQWLDDEHGMTRGESTSLIRMALALARERTEADVEEMRSVMVLRLEQFIDRSREALELRNELGGLKQLAIVQGLSKTDPEDAMAAFGAIVKRFDSKDSSGSSGKGPTIDVGFRALPG